VIGWSAGSGGDAYQLLTGPAAADGSCAGVALALASTTAATAATDAGRYAPQGRYECYEVRTAQAGWTSVSANPVVAARLGFVASAVDLSNGGTAGQLGSGDQIVVTFNQAVATGGRPGAANTVCVDKGTATIALASTGSGGSCSAVGNVVGAIAAASASRTARYAATYAWPTASQLRITIGAQLFGGQPAAIGGGGTLKPSGALVSQTGGFPVCSSDAGGGDCLPEATGSL
jgi:hypothetical protein